MKVMAKSFIEHSRQHVQGLGHCFGLVMSFRAAKPERKCVAFCNDDLKRNPPRQRTLRETADESFTVLAVGLDEEVYPSVCVDEPKEKGQIFEYLRVLRDGDPFSRFGVYDELAKRIVEDFLVWDAAEATAKSVQANSETHEEGGHSKHTYR